MRQAIIELVGDRDRSNLLAVGLVYAAVAAGGSISSVLIIWCVLYILGHVAAGRQSFRYGKDDLIAAGSCTLFALAIAASAIAGGGSGIVSILLKTSVFLMPLVLIPGLRLSRGEDLLKVAMLGSAAGGSVLLVVALVEYAWTGARVVGLSGNEGPLSITSLVTAGFSLVAFGRSRSRLINSLAVVGCIGGAVAVILSGMRGAWPALPVCIGLALIARRGAIAEAWRRVTPAGRWTTATLVVVGAVAFCALFLPLVVSRLNLVLHDVALLGSEASDSTSIGRRVLMYQAAPAAIADHPWLGYGLQNLWNAIQAHASAVPTSSYNHLHNVFLTIAVSAGAIGLCTLLFMVVAPLWIGIRTRFRDCGVDRLACSLILVLAFLIPGMTNIMFFHDILDTLWAFTISLLAATVPRSKGVSGP